MSLMSDMAAQSPRTERALCFRVPTTSCRLTALQATAAPSPGPEASATAPIPGTLPLFVSVRLQK